MLAAGVVQEQVLGDQELQLVQPLLDMVRVRLGLRGVLADQVERPDAPVVQPGHHLVEAVPRRLGERDPPGLGELAPDLGILLGLVPRQVARVRASVVQALDVVLPAQRVQAGRLVPEVAGHQHEVGQRPDVVDRGRVLGDPERVEDRRVPLGRVLARGRADRLGGHAGHLLRLLGRVARDDLGNGVEVLGVLADVVLVLQALLEDHVHDRVQEPDVGPGPQLQVTLRDLRQPDLAWVGDDERRPVARRLLHPQRQHRVRLGRVRPDHEQEARVLDLGDRVGGSSSA